MDLISPLADGEGLLTLQGGFWGVGYEEYGLPFGLRARDRGLLAQLLESVELPGWNRHELYPETACFTVSSAGGGYQVCLGDEPCLGAVDNQDLQAGLERLVHCYLAENSRDPIFIHAGVAVWKGRAILLPGRSGSGKSTMVSALVEQGAAYFSDEFAPLDRKGRVQAFPRRISLRHPAEHRLAVRSGGLAPCPVGTILDLCYREDSLFEVTSISPGEGALALWRNAVAARKLQAEVLTVVGPIAASARCWRGQRGEAQEAADRILNS